MTVDPRHTAADRRRNWDMRFLDLARLVASWSKDPSTQCGAVIVDPDNRIVSVGFNGLARGVEDTPARLDNRDVKLKIIIHAEENALQFARQDLRGCRLYVWPFMPCAHCAAMVIQAGITEVIAPPSTCSRWAADFRLSLEMFNEAGVGLLMVDPPDFVFVEPSPAGPPAIPEGYVLVRRDAADPYADGWQDAAKNSAGCYDAAIEAIRKRQTAG